MKKFAINDSAIMLIATWETIQFLPSDELKLEAIKFLMDYSFYEEIPKTDNPYINMVLTQALPNINGASLRYKKAKENGETGGRPPIYDKDIIVELKDKGYTQAQIAQELGCHINTVKTTLRELNHQTEKEGIITDNNLNIDADTDIELDLNIEVNKDVDIEKDIDINEEDEAEEDDDYDKHIDNESLLDFNNKFGLDYSIENIITLLDGMVAKLTRYGFNHKLPGMKFNNLLIRITDFGDENKTIDENIWDYFRQSDIKLMAEIKKCGVIFDITPLLAEERSNRT